MTCEHKEILYVMPNFYCKSCKESINNVDMVNILKARYEGNLDSMLSQFGLLYTYKFMNLIEDVEKRGHL